MLDIFTDNWMELPTLNDNEHMYRIYTNNRNDVLFVIADDSMSYEELEEEVRFALRRKRGKAVRLLEIEDVSCLIYEDDYWKED